MLGPRQPPRLKLPAQFAEALPAEGVAIAVVGVAEPWRRHAASAGFGEQDWPLGRLAPAGQVQMSKPVAPRISPATTVHGAAIESFR